MSRFLALDADARGLFVVAARLRPGGGIVVEHALAAADDPAPLNLTTAAATGERLKDLLRQGGVKPAPVLLAVGRDRVILKDVRFPPTPPAEEPLVVRFQAVKDLTESPDDVHMDYIPAEAAAPDGDRRALAVFVRKDLYQAAKQLCEAAGLKLAGVTPRPFAAAAALRHAFATGAAAPPDHPLAPVAVVSLWDRGGEFTVVRGTEIAFSRSISAHALSAEQALAAEIKRNLAVYAGQNPAAPVQAVYVAEADDPGAGWSGRLADVLPVPVQTFDPIAGTAAADLVPPVLHGRFTGPVGLLAARATNTLGINFAAPRQPRAEPSKSRPRVLIGALAGLLILAMAGAFAYLEVDKAGRRVRDLKAEQAQLDEELARYELDSKRLAAADEFTNREVPIPDELYDLTDRVPDVSKVSVTEIDIAAIAPPRTTGRPGSPQPVTPRNAPPPPVASIRVTFRSSDGTLVQRAADGFRADRYYAMSPLMVGGQGDAQRGQQFTLTGQVMHRKPDQYHRRLPFLPPPPPGRQNRGGGDEFDGFDGGFGGFAP